MVRRAGGCGGFTLIELLVVIGVIVLLGGMIMAAVPIARAAVKRSAAGAIVAQCALAAGRDLAERGSGVSPGLHPVAATVAPRLAFVRGGAGFTGGDAVAGSGEALRADSVSMVAMAARSRLLLSDDRFADPSFPALFGLRRDELTVLGGRSGLDSYRELPALASWNDRDADGVLDPPYDGSRYPDARYLQLAPGSTADLPARAQVLVDSVLGSAKEELAGLGALATGKGGSILGGRLLAEGPAVDSWRAGHYRSADGWRRYWLPGLAVYDPWGNEILASKHERGWQFVSAGADGHFAIDPGANGTLDSSAVGALGGDDRDARGDNIAAQGDDR